MSAININSPGGNVNTGVQINFPCCISVSWIDEQWANLTAPLEANRHGLVDLLTRILLVVPLILAKLVLTVFSCLWGDCSSQIHHGRPAVVGSGRIQERRLDLSRQHITHVELSNIGNLRITHSDEAVSSLQTRADDNILDLLQARIEGNSLFLECVNGAAFQTRNPISYELNIPLTNAVFTCTISGSGSVHVGRGTAQRQTVTISGSGDYVARDFQTALSVVTINGSGSATVRATDRLEARISGSGHCTYLGSPSVDSRIAGSGSVLPG